MRTIKFRGKASNGEWIYGSLVRICGELVGIKPDTTPFIGDNVRVNPDTVGQYTGRNDCVGNPIYEGDIIGLPSIYTNDSDGYTPFWVVEYDPWEGFKGFPREKVMGNIHDNPEMIKV